MSHATTPEIAAIAATLNASAAAALQPQNINGLHFVVLPEGYQRQDVTEAVEKAQPAPYRKRGTVQTKDVASLLQYCTDQAATDSAYIYVDVDSRQITAVFNDQRASGTSGWRDHRATYKAEYTPEFNTWLKKNREAMTQEAFAEFIEDNMADLVEATTLLDVAGTLSAKTGIDFRSSKRLDNGQAQLTYTETINATAGADGTLTIPKEFNIGVRIFKNGEGFKLRARLKYRIGSGGVKFWFELDRPERAIEMAFQAYIDKVRADSGYTVLLGTP